MIVEPSAYGPNGAWARISNLTKGLITSIFGSFVIFQPNAVGFLFSEGYIQQNFLSATFSINIPKNAIKSIESYLVGISSFSFDATNAISFTSSLDSFQLQIGPIYTNTINTIGFHYLLIAKGVCSDCVGHPILSNGTCVAVCPKNTVVRGAECVDVYCPEYSTFDGKNCFCDAGYHNFKEICISCPQNTVFDAKSPTGCVCSPGFYNISGVCTSCGQNSRFNGNGCECLQGYYVINGQCDVCRTGQWYPKLNKCGPTCGKNSNFDGKACVCLQGFYVING